MDELPENFIDRSFAGGGAKNQGYGNGTAFERMNGWGGSGKDWTSDNRTSTKKETPSYLAQKPPFRKLSNMFLLQILKPATYLICKWGKK
jgi:DNA helicase-2/ATP-dependent DNA helicase PcrA